MIYAAPGVAFEAETDSAPPGLVGTIGVRLIDTPAGTTIIARTTAGVLEQPPGSGLYATTLTAPEVGGTYSVVWDTGGASPAYAREELVVNATPSPGPAPAPSSSVVFTNLVWLRKLLEDEPEFEVEAARGTGDSREFYVANPPIQAPVTVSVGGALKADPADYAVPDPRTIRFTTAPANNANIVFKYVRQTFADSELEHYLAQAALKYESSAHIVYRGAIYAIDALLVGTATALRFGAGSEEFDMPSVHQRLRELRTMYVESLRQELEDDPALEFVDVVIEQPPITYGDEAVWG